MRKGIVFLLLAIIIALLVIYNGQLLFYLQIQLLKKHVTMQSPVVVRDHSEKINFSNLAPYSKVWAHRVNTLQRFEFLLNHFQGFEMDVVFDEQENFFDVRHPPAATIGLSFEKYLLVKKSNDRFFWLDVKNLNNDNEKAILSYLEKLDHQYHIRPRIIVESNNIAALSKLSEAGYFTSYYYDWNSYDEFTKAGSKRSRDSIFKKIDAVSQDVLIYDTLLKRFPAKPRLTWALSVKNYLSDSLFCALDNDKNLLVYLVNVRSPQYR